MSLTKSNRHTNPGINGERPMHDWQRKQLFGLQSKDKWPDEGCKSILHNGIVYYVRPINHTNDAAPSRRAMALCPKCGKPVCAGHLGQHLSAHDVKEIRGVE